MNTHEPAGIGAAFVVDDFGGARAMTTHLVAVGCRRIAHIRGPANDFQSLERVRGYRAGLAGGSAQVIDGDFTEESGYLAGRALATSHTRPDAVFAANDTMAIGCLFALTEAGVRVPHDIALAGFDDIPLARFVSPPLTTVRVDIAEMGRRALESLVGSISDPQAAGRSSIETVPVELVVRASCGAASQPRTRREEAGE
jgi:LacI family transcriptional regulator